MKVNNGVEKEGTMCVNLVATGEREHKTERIFVFFLDKNAMFISHF